MEDAIHGVPGHSEVQLGSARSFGLWFSAIFTIAGLLPLRTGGAVRLWAIGVGCAFLVLALAVPAVLQPLNVVWGKFGLLLGRVMNPIVLGILFYGVVTPIGFLMRRSGKDPLRLAADPGADSYWLHRPPGPAPETMSKQY